jgi:hypothetical protein
MERSPEAHRLQRPHRFLDSAYGFARNDTFGVTNSGVDGRILKLVSRISLDGRIEHPASVPSGTETETETGTETD